MDYKQLQREVRTLREQGLVSEDLRLNSPKQVLQAELNRCQARQERIETLKNSLIIIWLVLICLAIGSALLWLTIKLTIKLTRILDSQILQPSYKKLLEKVEYSPEDFLDQSLFRHG